MQFAIYFEIEIVEYLCRDTCPFIPLFAINIYSTDNTVENGFAISLLENRNYQRIALKSNEIYKMNKNTND